MRHRLILASLLAFLPAGPLSAQWVASPELRIAAALGTMGDYLGRGSGFGLSLRNGSGPIRLRLQAGWTKFSARGVSRPYNGSGTDIGITSSANIILLTAGPELVTRLGPLRVGATASAGGASVMSSGSTIFPGDPQQVNRSNTYNTATWAGALSASVATRIARNVDVAVEGSYVQLGKSKFLREYNLPIGYISGIYLNPTPYAPSFAAASLALRLRI